MAKPKGHKAMLALRAAGNVSDVEFERILRDFIEPADGAEAEKLGLRCPCGQYVELLAQGKSSGVHQFCCPTCNTTRWLQRHDSGATEILSATECPDCPKLEVISLTPPEAIAQCWNKAPWHGLGKPYVKARNQLDERGRACAKEGIKAQQDKKWCRLLQKRDDAANQLVAAYGKVDRLTAERIRARLAKLHKRAEFLIRRRREVRGDPVIVAALKENRDDENHLLDIHVKSAAHVGFLVSKLGSASHRKALESERMQHNKRRQRMAKADSGQERQHLLDNAEIVARADKRGHIAPIEPHAKELLFAVRELVEPNQLPKKSNVYDFARHIRWENCATWPTIHHLVMAFAERSEVLLPIIRKCPEDGRRQWTQTRPVRYSPTVMQHLIQWWIEFRGREWGEEVREGFARVSSLLPR